MKVISTGNISTISGVSIKSYTEFVAAKPHAVISTAEVIRMLHELKDWPQGELARLSGISVTNISLFKK